MVEIKNITSIQKRDLDCCRKTTLKCILKFITIIIINLINNYIIYAVLLRQFGKKLKKSKAFLIESLIFN